MSRASKAPAPLKIIRSIVDADIPDHAEKSLFGPYLPRGEVTLLSAHGGEGKSGFAAFLAAACAAGAEVAGAQAQPCKVLYVSAEDPASRIRGFLRTACRWMKLPTSAAENVDLLDLTEEDPILWGPAIDRHGPPGPTTRLRDLESFIGQAPPDLVVIDNASDVFAGNENARPEVSGFVRYLRRIAREHDLSMLMLAHVNAATARASKGDGQSFSGSTAWHNSARSRLAIIDGELQHQKRQFGPPVEPLVLRWFGGGSTALRVPAGLIQERKLAPQVATTTITEIAEDAEAMAARVAAEIAAKAETMKAWMADVMAALHRAHECGTVVPASKTGPRPAKKILPQYGCEVPSEEIPNVLDKLKEEGVVAYVKGRRDGKDRVDVMLVKSE